ncbi:acyltransferase family protein [Methanolobus profundi]|uniref:Fucose 4-O-acetylase n=1 Tax=Methanolobus profundi TaxID=487685 RepID=A0A1I4RVD8_9EURY|nr:acyltransferase family protein [Methanolobus profundi]SFM56217.1 Fucose 4-O-acetylase [Methanolobus profundi]
MRHQWIDSLKGFAIILVVIGHLNDVSEGLNTYIYSFHMPLFFFISGYLFNYQKYKNNSIQFIRKKINSLVIPYFTFTLISYLYYIITDYMYEPNITNIELLGNGIIYNLYTSIFAISKSIINTPLWFLPCLFITELTYFYILTKVSEKKMKLMIILVASALIGYLYSSNVTIRLPWGLDIAFVAIIFYAAGNILKKHFQIKQPTQNTYTLFLLFVFSLSFCLLNKRVDMYNLVYNNYILFYTSAFLGIIFYMHIFLKIEPSNILSYYGQNSIIILGIHYPLISSIKYMILFLSPIISIQTGIYLFALKLILVIIFLIPIIYVINNYIPFIICKKRAKIK